MPFKNVTDKDGNKIKAEDFKYYYIYPDGKQVGSDWLTKELDTKELGIYKVRVFHIESREYSNVSTVTIKEDKSSLKTKDLTVDVEQKISWKEGFSSATDENGKDIPWSDKRISIEGVPNKETNIDTSKPGVYEYTLIFKGKAKNT
ncbi:bacterial Ig-like domain-containing protein, partial [Enterococcus quebecensis]|uniref:bacterial Ig-like domain-containing protein n=1 Tax=Enterococcus quebecensis TaxID=903983 RepID=UPI003D16026B